ncbi:hypothetical protein Gotur_019150 [Gossypium turneri]
MLLLCSLPPSYKSFRETLIYGSIVTGGIGRPSSVMKSKSTRLERRQLGHRGKRYACFVEERFSFGCRF